MKNFFETQFDMEILHIFHSFVSAGFYLTSFRCFINYSETCCHPLINNLQQESSLQLQMKISKFTLGYSWNKQFVSKKEFETPKYGVITNDPIIWDNKLVSLFMT